MVQAGMSQERASETVLRLLERMAERMHTGLTFRQVLDEMLEATQR
jgi:hypothetical protein